MEKKLCFLYLWRYTAIAFRFWCVMVPEANHDFFLAANIGRLKLQSSLNSRKKIAIVCMEPPTRNRQEKSAVIRVICLR